LFVYTPSYSIGSRVNFKDFYHFFGGHFDDLWLSFQLHRSCVRQTSHFGARNSRSQAQKPWSVNKPRKILDTITCCFSPQFLLPNSFGVWICDWAVFFFFLSYWCFNIKNKILKIKKRLDLYPCSCSTCKNTFLFFIQSS
jgi:hypothetical protein